MLTGDVIVERGSTLTISKGVTIDASTHRILVNGTLIGDGITISSTAPDVGPASSGAGRWTGFEVSQDGTLELSNSSILHAKTAFLIDGTANLSNVSVGTSYVGVDIHGAAHLDEVRCDGIDFECILARGTVTATDIEVSNTSTGFDVTGALDVSEATFERRDRGSPLERPWISQEWTSRTSPQGSRSRVPSQVRVSRMSMPPAWAWCLMQEIPQG